MRQSLRNQYGLAIGIFIIGIALAAVGVCFLNIGNQASGLADFVRSWPEVPGTITSAALDASGREPRPAVRYTYRVEDQDYEGTRVFLSDGPYHNLTSIASGIEITYVRGNAETMRTLYQNGQSVMVAYNPKAPKESTLNRIVLGTRKRFVVMGVLGVIAGMIFVVRSLASDN